MTETLERRRLYSEFYSTCELSLCQFLHFAKDDENRNQIEFSKRSCMFVVGQFVIRFVIVVPIENIGHVRVDQLSHIMGSAEYFSRW